MLENKEYVNNKPLTASYYDNGTLIEVYGNLNIEVLAKALLNYYNKKDKYNTES